MRIYNVSLMLFKFGDKLVISSKKLAKSQELF